MSGVGGRDILGLACGEANGALHLRNTGYRRAREHSDMAGARFAVLNRGEVRIRKCLESRDRAGGVDETVVLGSDEVPEDVKREVKVLNVGFRHMFRRSRCGVREVGTGAVSEIAQVADDQAVFCGAVWREWGVTVNGVEAW